MIAFANPLRPIEDFLTNVLEWLHSTAGLSWAWSIVALVVLVRLVLVPVTVRQIHSMQNLQAHAPEMKEIQQRWKHDRQRQNEELMKFYRENKINPAASCLPIVLQIPIFISLFYVLKGFEREVFPNYPGSSLDFLGLVDITEPTKDGWGPLLLVIYVGSQLTSSYFMAATMQKAQRIMLMVLPIVFIPFILNFPVGLMIYWLTTNLWTTGQGIVTRKMMPRPNLDAAAPELAHAAEGGAGAGSEAEAGLVRVGHGRLCAGRRRPAPARQAETERRGQAEVSDELSVEATGETVGEAKWSALRELEQLAPGIDREAVRFQVVTEGERGLLGVGYTPARVVATVERPAVAEADAAASEEGESAVARALLERTLAALALPGSVRVDEGEDEVTATVTGPDLGVLIGRHGQMIDALQYLANAIAHRAVGEERRRIVVDAAGYRARRAATLEGLARRSAEQASATGRPVALEPMSAVERRIVHEALKDDPEVATASEGAEPNRYVVVLPQRSAD